MKTSKLSLSLGRASFNFIFRLFNIIIIYLLNARYDIAQLKSSLLDPKQLSASFWTILRSLITVFVKTFLCLDKTHILQVYFRK